MDFSFVKLYLTIELLTDVEDRYILFSLRQPFESEFRQTLDCRRDTCRSCPETPACPYFQTFSQYISTDPAAVKRYQKPPLPFIFDMPVLPPLPNRGVRFEIGLTLIGNAVNNCSHYLAAVRRMLELSDARRSLRVEILKVEIAGYRGERLLVKEGTSTTSFGNLQLLSLTALAESVLLPATSLPLKFVTPLRLIHDGTTLRDFTPSILLRSLLRRISTLAYYYGGTELDYDFRWLAEQSTRILWLEPAFRWSEWKKNLSGITGKGVLSGDLVEFHPFLLAGEFFHAGKGASFGLGHYQIEQHTS